MSLDSRISGAVGDLERHTSVDVATSLERLRQTDRRRSTTRKAGFATVLVLLAAGAVWRLSGPPRQPDPAPDLPHVSNGVLVSIRAADGDVLAVGGSIAHLPVGVPDSAHLVWSADATELIHNTTNGSLVALDVETGGVRILATCAKPCLAGVSPDTSGIARAADGEIRIRTDESESVIPLPGLSPGVPVWSPDATRIAFTAPTGLYVVGVDGSGVRQLVASPDERVPAMPPSWSPDGQSLAYLAGSPVPGNPGGTDDVLLTAFSVVAVDAASGRVRTLADVGECFCLGLPPAAVAWSPDGSLIGFTRTQVNGLKGVFAVPALGGDAARLSDKLVGGSLAWQPVLD